MSENKKIIIVLYDLGGGGAERMYVNLANDWVKLGFSVEIILMQMQGVLLPLLLPEISVRSFNTKRIRDLILPLARYLRKTRYDIILTAWWPRTSAVVISWIISGRYGKLFLSDLGSIGFLYIEKKRALPWFVRCSIRFTYPLASGIIVASRGLEMEVCELGNLNFNRVRKIYNAAATCNCVYRESLEVKEKLWGRGVDHNILSVGKLDSWKDHKTLIKAFSLLPKELNAKLIILGDGPLREELTELIKQLGLKDLIAMPGFVIDPLPWFRTADLFALSSRSEGFGNVIVEALECGVPVVSTNCPSGPAEILENGRLGKLVPVQDHVAFAYAMEQSLNETHDREKLMRRAQDFSLRKISDEYLDYFFPEGF